MRISTTPDVNNRLDLQKLSSNLEMSAVKPDLDMTFRSKNKSTTLVKYWQMEKSA